MIKTITKTRAIYRRNVVLFAMVLSLFSFGKLIAQPLNGSYTIGTGGSYSTMAAALSDLGTNGVSGPVTMTILPGNYAVASTIFIGNYAGVDVNNRLTFTSNNRDSVVFTGTISGAIIALNQCRYVTVNNISVVNNINTGNGSGIGIIGSTTTNAGTGNTISRCKVNLPFSSSSYTSFCIGTTTSATGYGTGGQVRADSITIDSNITLGGYYTIYFYAPTALSNAYAREIKIRNNILNDVKYYGMYLFYLQNGVDVINNTVSCNATAFFGIYLGNVYNHYVGNNPHRINDNKVYNSAYGIYMTNMNSLAANPSQIYNNVVVGRAGIYNYGIYMTSNASYAANHRIYHNTVKLLNATYGYGLYVTGNNAGNSISCMNNIFALGTTNAGYYPAYFVTNPVNPTGGQAINNNVYYSVGSSSANILYRAAAYNVTNYNLSTSGGDSSSIVKPSFTNTEFDGHLLDACNKKGSPLGSFIVPLDIDGQARSVTEPLIGADESASLINNLMATALVTPTMPISSGAQDLSVRIKNSGSNTVSSFDISYRLNNGTPVTIAYSGTLLPCTDTVIVFTGANQITLGNNNVIKVYTANPNFSADADPTNDTINVTLKAPLSGTFTIGTGGNYPTFQAAAADLVNGVGGPVLFNVLPGAYLGQVIINGPVAGASAINTITFEGNASATRTLTASMANQAAFVINRANYVKLRNLTITNSANGSTVVGIVGDGVSNAGTGCAVVNCILNLNPIQTTSYGISVTGTPFGHGQTACRTDSITLDSNVINNAYYGISVYGAQNTLYNRGNKIRYNMVNAYYMGVAYQYNYASMDIIANTVLFPSNSTMGYAYYLYFNNQLTGQVTNIIGNKSDGAAYSGIYCYTIGTGEINIYNNATSRQNYQYTYGLYLYANSSSLVRVLHNSFSLDVTQSGNTYGAMVSYLPVNSIVKNNIFACTATTGPQTPMYLYSGPGLATNNINYNLYWNAAGTNALYRGSAFTSANYKTVAAGGDSSYFADPKFVGASNLAVTTCFNGVDLLSTVSTDILNVARLNPPKVGAYENTTPISYLSSSAVQMTGQVAPGAVDFPVLRTRVALQGCGTGYTTNVYYNTIGSTSASNDIVSAKLYSTGIGSNFNTSKLIGTVFSPVGAFSFAISDTVNRDLGDTVNYWLTYDVSSSATNTNLLDARIDSINILGSNRVPSNNNPTGSLIVAAPMTYVSSTSLHPSLSTVATASTNVQMLRISITTSTVGSPIAASSFSLNTTGGGNDTLNLINAKIYYTGNSASFSAANLFGTYAVVAPTTSAWPAYAITGSQQLVNGINYFWLTYDLKTAAVIGDSIDAEVTSVSVAGSPQTPTVTAPVGIRKIRAEYCASAATTTADGEIWNVTVGSLNNTSNCTTTGGLGSTLSMYSNYTATLAAPGLVAGIPIPFSVNTSTCGGQYNGVLGIWIDFNQDGDFLDLGEAVHMSPSFLYGTAIFRTGTITIPCTAMLGETRMRVSLIEGGVPPLSSCASYGYGETEDYLVTIVNGAPVFNSATAIQVTGSTSAGANDVPILRVPVKVTASPCSPGVITNVRFNTAGTTTVGDIVAAKLYKTGTSPVFANTNLLGTIFSPSGLMEFFVTDTVNNDTNNYWLAYDVSSSATNSNVLDARFDSAEVFGAFRTPVIGNPTGNRVISVPMTYISSTSVHTDLSSIQPASVNNRMLRIRVRTSSTGAPISLTSFSLNTNGSSGNDTLNLANAKMFYTGSSSVFNANTQFGSTYSPVAPSSLVWPSYQINGVQPLLNDTNYFWLTYDLKGGAITLDSVDAEVTSIVVASISQTPTVSAPVGNRRIRNAYCASAATTTADGEIWNVTIGTLNNTSSCTTTGGPGSILSGYSNYTETLNPVNLIAGMQMPFSVNASTCGGQYNGVVGIWIDLNQDGDFLDAGETQYMSPSSFLYGTAVFITGNIIIPCTATPGLTRMRVTQIETGTTPISSCGTYGYGETEDYAVNIVNGAPSFTNTTAVQNTGIVLAGTLDVPILRVPMKVAVSACSPGLVTNVRFNTAGTTTVGNITAAKLYKTTSSTFNTSKLLGTVFSPSGLMEFIVSDTASNDTNNYWLAYDVSTGAATSNVLDARFDSMEVFGLFRLPISGNPTGSVLVSNPIAPTLYTTAATNLTTTTATIGGGVTSNGFAIVTATGVVFATTPNPVRFGTGVIDSASVVAVTTGNYSFSIVGLTHSTKYYFRTYAINSVGTGYSAQDSFTTSPIISSLPYSQNFEAGAGGWTSALTSTNTSTNWIIGFATNNNWVLGTPAKTYLNGARSGTKAWVTKLTGTYDIDHDASVLSPQFNFTGYTNDPVVRFNHKFKAESDWDGLIVEVSVNNGFWRRADSIVGTGSNFNTVGSYSWYNDNVSYVSSGGILEPPYFSTDLGSASAFSSQDSGWIQSAFRLTGTAGQSNVRFRFRFISDTYVVDEGWALDDIEVVNIVAPTVLASSVSAVSNSGSTMNVSWTSGNGSSRIVVARLNTTTAVPPTNNTMYGSSAAFGGTNTTGTGNFIVYNGTGSSVVVTGLANATQYTFSVYEYNGKYMHNAFGTVSSASSTTLPVSWLSFSGFANEENVDLVWATAQEINNRGFEVERSFDGIAFQNVGFVKGAGTYNGKLNYSFVDEGVLAANPVVYYRLKQVDFDNRFEYSSTVVVRTNVDELNAVKVYPNPFTESVSIELRNTTELTGTATLIDIQGRVVKSLNLNVIKGFGTFQMSGLDELKDGVYFVKVNIGGQSYQEKLVKVGNK
ncbi:MAG: BNR-repeat neuraminidase N-terminal domain-containing protein [bacterium]|nr:BNR-repeat neuraminidase N-terminal domain-containing protein [bacterium]